MAIIYRGGSCREIKYIVKQHFEELEKMAIIRRWLLLEGGHQWRFYRVTILLNPVCRKTSRSSFGIFFLT